KLENVLDLYNKLEIAEDKNILLKSIIAKVTYLKIEKAISKSSDPTNFELHIYPKFPKI
ncbi:MAG: recombinase family protein, partial [Clostridia bacterium]|nr:recombinase family protein [Clostridia bacterium]